MKVSREFGSNFKKVCQHYQCTNEEVEEMKEAVRRDYEAAQESFAAMAGEIDGPRIERSVKRVERGFRIGGE